MTGIDRVEIDAQPDPVARADPEPLPTGGHDLLRRRGERRDDTGARRGDHREAGQELRALHRRQRVTRGDPVPHSDSHPQHPARDGSVHPEDSRRVEFDLAGRAEGFGNRRGRRRLGRNSGDGKGARREGHGCRPCGGGVFAGAAVTPREQEGAGEREASQLRPVH
jgi:hypothetical protein